jgi:xylulokinase
MKLLGIDVGTGGTRALVIDETGKILSSATVEHIPFSSPQIGWAEQDPDDWWRAAREAVREALSVSNLRGDEIASVGLSGQMHGSVLLDKDGKVIRPALIWCDQRTAKQCDEITDRVGAKRLIELSCNPALTGFTLPKLLWVRENEPALWERMRSFLLPKDYIRLKLTGNRATDVADASGTLLFDVSSRKWSSELLSTLELSKSILPETVESPEITGHLTAEAAEVIGLRKGIPVVGGAGDQAAGAVGMGIVSPGTVSATIGTSGVIFAATDRPALDPAGRVHTFCHAIPGRWHVMGVTQAAGLSLRWFRDTFGTLINDNRDPYERLNDEASAVQAGSDGLLWAPYLMGERTPHLDPAARAALVGLVAQHTRGHIIRAIMEGVAFSLKDSLTILKELNVPTKSIRLGGGGARSSLWQRIQTDIYGIVTELVEAEEGAAYGAAILAGVGARTWSSVDEACSAVVRIKQRLEPDKEIVARMEKQYRAYRLIYSSLKPINETI